jgi:plastocyanin
LRRGVALAAVLLASSAAAGTVTGVVTVVEKKGKAAEDVSETVVYVDGARGRLPAQKAVVTMKSKAFHPRLTVIPVGGTVEFPNEDPIYHNVFSVSGENRFDLDLYKRPKSGSRTFEHPGIVRVFCNIHPQMSAIIVVRDNPFFTRADDQGRFRIEGVPAGQYRLKAWHERGGETEAEITVSADGTTETHLALDASSFRRVPHKNKYGKDYSAPTDRY